MKSFKYPSDLPVFDLGGVHYEARPWLSASNKDDTIGVDGDIAYIDDDGTVTIDFISRETFPETHPLTRAARELLAWSRQ